MNNICKSVGALIISAFCCFAQNNAPVVTLSEHGVKFGAGIVTRHFENTRIKGTSGGYSVVTENYGAMNETITVVSGGTAGKMGVEAIDCFGPVLSLEYGIWQKDAITLSLIGEFQYYWLNNSRHINGRSTETHSYTSVNHPEFGPTPSEVYTFGDRFKAKVDMDLYILDIGLKSSYDFSESFGIFAAVGPTLTFADTESKVDGRHDSDEDFIFGVYAGVGMTYWFNEKVGISCEVRYDAAFEKVETKDIKQDINGFGGALKLLIAF